MFKNKKSQKSGGARRLPHVFAVFTSVLVVGVFASTFFVNVETHFLKAAISIDAGAIDGVDAVSDQNNAEDPYKRERERVLTEDEKQYLRTDAEYVAVEKLFKERMKKTLGLSAQIDSAASAQADVMNKPGLSDAEIKSASTADLQKRLAQDKQDLANSVAVKNMQKDVKKEKISLEKEFYAFREKKLDDYHKKMQTYFKVKLQLPFTPQEDGKQQEIMGKDGEELLQRYSAEIYKYLAGAAGILAVLMITFAGIQISTSGASDGVGDAKERIMGAMAGLALLFLSGLILHTINPTFFV